MGSLRAFLYVIEALSRGCPITAVQFQLFVHVRQSGALEWVLLSVSSLFAKLIKYINNFSS